jgi:hypothetical protein
MAPDICAICGSVKYSGQLAQLSSCALRLGFLAASASILCGAALTLLVIGFPRQAVVCLREVLR